MFRIMPFGDSLTEGYNMSSLGGYRIRLHQLLTSASYQFRFVGEHKSGPAMLTSQENQGYQGNPINFFITGSSAWIRRNQPDLVLLMIGTAQIVLGTDTGSMPAQLDTLVNSILSSSDTVSIMLLQLPPLSGSARNSIVSSFNASMPALVASKVSSGRRVTLVNTNTSFTASIDTSDGTHPTEAAYNEIANRIYSGVLSDFPLYGAKKSVPCNSSDGFFTTSTRTGSVYLSQSFAGVLAEENHIRNRFEVFNDSLYNMFLKLGENAASNDYHVKVPAQKRFVLLQPYTGSITATLDSLSGSVFVTETSF